MDPVDFFHMNKLVGEMVIMNDLEWTILLYYVIYYKSSKKSYSEQKRKL